MVPAQQCLNSDHAPALRRDDGLIVQIEIVCADGPWQLAVDEFLIGGDGINGNVKCDDRSGPSFRGRTQRKVGAARQLTAGRSVMRRLRKTCVRGHAHDRVGPIRTCNRIDGRTDNVFDVLSRGHYDGEFVTGYPPADDARRQRFPQSTGYGDQQLVAAQNAERRGDIVHAVQLDQRKGRALVVDTFCEGKVQELQCLCMIGKSRQLVFVGGTRSLHLPRRKLPLRPLELPERQCGKSEYNDADGCKDRRQPSHELSHRTALVPRNKSGNAAGGIHQRLRFAVSRGAVLEFQVFQAGNLFRHAQQPRIDPDRTVESRTEFHNRAAQGGMLVERQPLVTVTRQNETDHGNGKHAREGDKRKNTDQTRCRQDPLCGRRPRERQ